MTNGTDWRAEVERYAALSADHAGACAWAEAAVGVEVELGEVAAGSPDYYRRVLDVAVFLRTLPGDD